MTLSTTTENFNKIYENTERFFFVINESTERVKQAELLIILSLYFLLPTKSDMITGSLVRTHSGHVSSLSSPHLSPVIAWPKQCAKRNLQTTYM